MSATWKSIEPLQQLTTLVSATTTDDPDAQILAREAGYRLGDGCAADDLTIEEAFELLEREVGDALPTLHADVLGSIVRGYVDHVVRQRGVTRRRSAGRLSSHVSRMAALHRINRAATASLQLDDMLATVVQVVTETISVDACSVFLLDDPTQTLVLRATVGLNPDLVGKLVIRSDAGITGMAAETREIQIAPIAREHPAFFTYPSVGEDRYTSQASIPLVLREPDRLVGVMNIQTEREREIDQDEVAFLETAAGELAIAIENARLYSTTDAALRRRIRELNALRSVARSLASTLNIDDLYPLVASQAASLTTGDASALFLVGRALPTQVSQAIYWPNDEVSFDAAFVETVLHSRSALVHVVRTNEDELILGAPLMTAHGVLGVICSRVSREPNHTDERLGLFQAFADSAALALENAELYNEARRGMETASILLQEMHHRVRNNLQTVAALLKMQARDAAYADWTQPLQEAVARVQSIAAVHSLLSDANVTSAEAGAVLKHVIDEASVNVVPPDTRITFTILPSNVEVSSRQATILALIVNECITNAIEHGFAERTSGSVDIEITSDERNITVEVRDDGAGVSPTFDVTRDAGLGLRIASTLAQSDLRGSYSLVPNAATGAGARSIIRFPPQA